MKVIYFECNMGAAGDMLMAALLELCDDKQGFLNRLNAVGIPGVAAAAEPSTKCGITGTRVKIAVYGREEECHHHENHHDHPKHHHSHNSYHDIEHLVDRLKISQTVKENVLAIYKLIAAAESRAHGVPIDKIHFHEIGEKDAIADITGVCMLMEELSPDAVYTSPINTGSGHVHCAHGILPVPAPATVHILQNVPIYGDSTVGELCTPTGAAILKHFTEKFCGMPIMSITKIGYGMGKNDFKKANCVRAYIGEPINATESGGNEYVTELSCNLDDMTPEAIAFARELLLQEGALDVWALPIAMKKGRLGTMLSCLCLNGDKDKMVSQIFKHTTTLGVRENTVRRYTLQREDSEIETRFGPVKIKNSGGFGVERSKIEYEDAARIARDKGISIDDVLNAIRPHD